RSASLPHVRPVQPLRFPSSEPEWEKMPESRRHYIMRSAVYQMLKTALGDQHTYGCDQFVYFDAGNPKRKLAPDAFVKVYVPDHEFDSFLTWEEGVPGVAFEILSPSDSPERWTFEEKLKRYRALGVGELVVMSVDGRPGERLHVWDRLQHDLVERVVLEE